MSHSYAKLYYHCVFSTKDRVAFLEDELDEKVNGYIFGIVRQCEGYLIKAGGTSDHRHLLLELKPTVNVSDILRLIKTNSSKWIRSNFKQLSDFGWQVGYSAFTVSASGRDAVKSYIENQKEHHRGPIGRPHSRHQ